MTVRARFVREGEADAAHGRGERVRHVGAPFGGMLATPPCQR